MFIKLVLGGESRELRKISTENQTLKQENEANYFAFKILGKEIDPSYDYAISQYAKLLNVNEDTIEYIATPERI